MQDSRPGRRHSVMVVYGTRPEAIKMAPLVRTLSRDDRFRTRVVVTGQHRTLMDPVNEAFGIQPDVDLDLFRAGSSLTHMTARVLTGVSSVVQELRPDLVVVQGDTTTAFGSALAAYQAGVGVVHLEAGLRTGRLTDPFPEESHRRLISGVTDLHLAPTECNRRALLQEGVRPDKVVVTGNTGIDALLSTAKDPQPFRNPDLRSLEGDIRRKVLVTAHRRESWGEPMRRIAAALATAATAHPQAVFVLPMHGNPAVREDLVPSLAHVPNVLLTEPLDYRDGVRLLKESAFVVTDSGGLQEEAPALGKPVLILRDTTERGEVIELGVARLVGTREEVVVDNISRLIQDGKEYSRMARVALPYGDGAAASRCVEAIAALPQQG